MHTLLIRRFALVTMIVFGAFAANTYSFDEWAAVSAQPAQAHGASTSLPAFSSLQFAQMPPDDGATAAPTPTETPPVEFPTDTVTVPTDTATAASDTPTIATATDTPIGVESPTATPIESVTPTPTPSVPPLSPTPDTIGTVATAVIGSAGGTLVTADQRVTLNFPAGALDGDATVSVTTGDPSDPSLPSISADRPALKRWTFDATDVADPSQSLSPFATPIIVIVRINPDELRGSNPKALVLWTLDETANTWAPVPALLNPDTLTLAASLPHFSFYQLAGNQNVDMAPFTNIANVNLNSGSATLSIPIEVPAGPGGMKPDISLTYDSGRVDQMLSPISLGSWAGIGWDLNMGGISGDLSTGAVNKLQALTVDAGGVSGKLLRDGATWYVMNDKFAKVELLKATGGAGSATYCSNAACYWIITVRGGTKYYFGETDYYAWRMMKAGSDRGSCRAQCAQQFALLSYPRLGAPHGVGRARPPTSTTRLETCSRSRRVPRT